MPDGSFRARVVLGLALSTALSTAFSAASALLAPRSRAQRRARAPAARLARPSADGDDVVYQSPSYYADALCGPDDGGDDSDDGDDDALCVLPSSADFCVAVLGDLHIDPRKLEDYEEGRAHFAPILADARDRGVSGALADALRRRLSRGIIGE